MNIGELIGFMEGVKKVFGDIPVKLHIHDCTDPYAPIEKIIRIDNITASKSLSLKNVNDINEYVQIHGTIGEDQKNEI